MSKSEKLMSDVEALRNQEMLIKIWLHRPNQKTAVVDVAMIGLLVLRGCDSVNWIGLP
jgi:hypothetical protein